ncbi:hypothetical protein KC19_2G226600 [Ceratodon purpureus]|uniref:Uncharacterized protein n=1 Tax=Ceratodon purpureus TaxID=3225 RepID=A0A8T0J0P6_CERPU|nr:hypothetical protein KC19_2G226600 [Ceratodon purpureus]
MHQSVGFFTCVSLWDDQASSLRNLQSVSVAAGLVCGSRIHVSSNNPGTRGREGAGNDDEGCKIHEDEGDIGAYQAGLVRAASHYGQTSRGEAS